MNVHREIEKNVQPQPSALAKTMEHHYSDLIAQQQQVNDHMTTATLPIELTNATETYLDHLNDDCLMEIFSYVSPMDLCSLAETCKRFKPLTQDLFPKAVHVERCDETSEYSILTNQEEGVEVHDVERMFKHFGSCIEKFIVSGSALDIMHLVAKHCVGTLKDLAFKNLHNPAVIEFELRPIFQQLQVLTIDHATLKCSSHVFRHCDSLTELRVIGQDERSVILKGSFPQLQRFTFDFVWCDEPGWWSNRCLLNFFERHANLRCVVIDAPDSRLRRFLQKLANICQQVQELTIYLRDALALDFSHFPTLTRLEVLIHSRFTATSIVQLQTLKSLEVLKIQGRFVSKEVLEALPLLKSLREFDVYLEVIQGKIQWTSLAQLTKLRLSNSYGNAIDKIVDIVAQLPNLKELEVDVHQFILTEKEFYEIVKVAQGRQNVLILKCRFEFSLSRETYLRICNKHSKLKLIKM